MHGGEVMYVGRVCFRGELGFLNCDDICMCVVNKQFELIELVFDSVYVDLWYSDISLTSTAGSMSLWCVCSHVVVFGLSVRLFRYPMCYHYIIKSNDNGNPFSSITHLSRMSYASVIYLLWNMK